MFPIYILSSLVWWKEHLPSKKCERRGEPSGQDELNVDSPVEPNLALAVWAEQAISVSVEQPSQQPG
jgi:hypothetical protein